MRCPRCKTGRMQVLKTFAGEGYSAQDRLCGACDFRQSSLTILVADRSAYLLAKDQEEKNGANGREGSRQDAPREPGQAGRS